MRRLILFRHARADSPTGIADAERPLSARGRAEAAALGGFMAREGLKPEAAVVSLAMRTRETWDIATAALNPPRSAKFDARLYNASAETLLEVVHEAASNVHSLLLLGHNPGIEGLARGLVAKDASPLCAAMAKKFPPAALAVIEFSAETWHDVEPATGRLVRYVTPEMLAEK
jgi:phosphohistidine phosphatase